MYTQELLTALRGIVGAPEISQEEKERVLLKLGGSVPFSILNSNGGLGHSNKSVANQWIRSACPDAEQLDPFYVAQGHAVDYATEVHREPPQAATEGGYPAVESYHVDKVHTEWTDAGTESLIVAHDDPDAVGRIKAREQRGRTEKMRKGQTTSRPTSTKALPRGSGFQNWLRGNSKQARNYLASGVFER
ncbi:unnamed protein product, partial [Sphacelaria rigidula]